MNPTLSDRPKPAAFFDIVLNVLGYEEDGEWAALALEMDLRGYGPTFEEAVEELSELVAMQISFASFKDQPEMIWKPAEPIWWDLFATHKQERLFGLARRKAAGTREFRVGAMVPPAHVIEALEASGWAGPSSTAS